jgi:hypothetical protein
MGLIGCLHPGCQRPARHRGNCQPQYLKALTAIHDGKTSWAELEKQGLAKPWTRVNLKLRHLSVESLEDADELPPAPASK